MKSFLTASLVIILTGSAATAQVGDRLRDRLAPPPTETLYEATTVLADLSKIPAKSIPPALLADAQGVAIIPHVIKAGFVVAGSGGHGVVMSRGPDGGWGRPVFVNFGGGSVGFQAGVKSTDVVLVFSNRKSLDRILQGKGKVTLGADAAVAAGPVGREAKAATDAKLEAEILSYSRSRGLFGGVALDGSVIRPDENTNAEYLKDTRPEVAKQVETLASVLNAMSGTARPADPAPGVVPGGVPPVVPSQP